MKFMVIQEIFTDNNTDSNKKSIFVFSKSFSCSWQTQNNEIKKQVSVPFK